MKTKKILIAGLIAAVLFFNSGAVYAQAYDPILLNPPPEKGGKTLMQALHERKSSRDFSSKDLPLRVLSELLWAAFGVNREETGKRTAPSAKNLQEIDIYVAMDNGVYLYDAKNHMLMPHLDEDVRAYAGRQLFVKEAPVVLIFVADHQKMINTTAEEKNFYEAIDVGYISQNVYLYCASAGLGTVALTGFSNLTLKKVMKLRPAQTIILTQPVGYPKY